MTTTRAAIHAAPIALPYGRTGYIVGRIDAAPHHPAPGTRVEPFTTGGEPITTADGVEIFALVAVTWATEHTTINADTGETVTEYRPRFPGMPSGTTFYLAPVHADADGHHLIGRRAAGYRTAKLPQFLTDLGAPAVVKIHDYPLG